MRRERVLTLIGVVGALCLAHLFFAGEYERPREFVNPMELDRQDCRVGVLRGYDEEAVARRVYPRAQIVGFSEFDDAFVALLDGKIEGFAYGEQVLNVGLRAYPNRFETLDAPIAKMQGSVLVSVKRTDLLPRVNRFIAGLRKSGVYADMFFRWCQSEEYVPMPEIPPPPAGAGVLRVGTSGTEEPMSFVNPDGELVGYDIEFARRLAQALHLRLEITAIPDDEILSALGDGKCDLVIDSYSAADAGEEAVASVPYFESDMKVLVRRGGDRGVMLGSTRLGYTSSLVSDPRLALFVRGFLTTLALTIVSALLGFGLAWGIRHVENRLPRPVQCVSETIIELMRLVPPPVVILFFSSAVFVSLSAWWIAAAAFALWFSAFLEPIVGAGPILYLPILRTKLVELMQWTSVVGAVGVCDLTLAADIACGRSYAAFWPLLSVAAAYVLMTEIVRRLVAFLEKKFA